MSFFENIDISKVPRFSFNGEKKKAFISDIYDGDTVTAIFDINAKMYKFACRLTGIDTPEIKTNDKKEKEYAIIVRDVLREKILHKIVELDCYEYDKYGRILVTITYDSCNINEWLVEKNYAKIYSGGTKEKWDFSQ